MIIAVSGWRSWTDREFIVGQLAAIEKTLLPVHVRVGDADGADKFVRDWVTNLENPLVTWRVYSADWKRLRSGAGPVRNIRMLSGEDEDGSLANWLVAFPEPGENVGYVRSGTWQCIRAAVRLGVSVRIPAYPLPITHPLV